MNDLSQRGDQRVLAVLWRGKHLIAISTIVMILLALILTLRSAKVYEATGIIQVSIPSQNSSQETTATNQALAQNFATLLVSPGFLNAIRSKVAGGGPEHPHPPGPAQRERRPADGAGGTARHRPFAPRRADARH